MSEQFWRKISFLSGLLPLGALFGLVAFVANVEIKDLDLWLHLGMGKLIWQTNLIPDVDILSCSIAGAPWVNHEWLFQILIYNIFNAWGPDGLLKMQIVVVCLTMAILVLIGYSRERQLITSFILFFVFMVYQQRFTLRPDLFSLLFFTLYIFILAVHIDKKWAPVALFLIQILWTNFHGFFFFGPLFVIIGLVSEWIKRNVRLPYEWNETGRLTDAEYQRIKFILFLVVLACLVNPLFVKGAWYPISVFFSLSGENKIFFKYIQELQKPLTWQTLFDLNGFTYYKLLIYLSVASFIFNRRKIDISALFFWLVFLIFSLNAARNTAFFAFAAYLVIITNLLSVSFDEIVPLRFTEKKFQYLTAAIMKLFFVIWLFEYGREMAMRGYFDFDKYEQKSEFGGISHRTYPNKAVDFLVENKIKGNFFNDFNSGAYLIGRAYPDIRVFIDGRTEVYGGEFFLQYQKIWEEGDKDSFEKAVQKYDLTGVLLNSSREPIPKTFLKYLYEHKEWVLVYFDFDGVIFLKDLPEYKPVIDQFAIDLTKWETKKLDLLKIGVTRVDPYQNYFRAYTLDTLDFDQQALSEAQAALDVVPGYAEVHHLMGKIYGKRKDFRQAFEHFRIAATITPANIEIRHNLALSYLDMEEFDGAIKQFQAIIDLRPDDPKGHFLLAKAYLKNKDYEKGIASIQKAFQLDPGSVVDIIALGDLAFEQQEYETSLKIYEKVFDSKADFDFPKMYGKLGQIYQLLGDNQKAASQYREGLSIDPDNEELKKYLDGLNLVNDTDENNSH